MKISSVNNVKRSDGSMSEILTTNKEFEQKLPSETEKKYVPIFPEQLAELREVARPIEQFYVSHPSEPFSLRFRETLNENGELIYKATLKDRGTITNEGLERLEVEIAITSELYHYYKTPDVPVVRKLRAEPNHNVAIDFMEDGRVLCESEERAAWTAFTDIYGSMFMEVTGDRHADNEWHAHFAYRREHNGQEALRPAPDLDIEQIAHETFLAYTRHSPVVVRLSGRSGSGKSTIVRQLQAKLQGYGLQSDVISTDDYHRGATWLTNYNNGEPWMQWDHPIVYDTETMAATVQRLLAGEVIPRREIDFSVVEPVYKGSIAPTPILIIEGIYARSPDLSGFSSLDYEIPTPVATCIGRRLLRDMVERPQFANPADSLRYMLEQAEPMWREQLSQVTTV